MSPNPCFNPRARVGRDAINNEGARQMKVSIHAPVWGATTIRAGGEPRHHVSIHAPVWGATIAVVLRSRYSLFQSTRPCGARPAGKRCAMATRLFQSTRPCGARRRCGDVPRLQDCFNPRARVGRDGGVAMCHGYKIVSIHAPVWGATGTVSGCPRLCGVSIHAPVWGATQISARYFGGDAVSIHAPVWGATIAVVLRSRYSLFQSTRPCGARHEPSISTLHHMLFVSIHAPVWGATGVQTAKRIRMCVSIHAPVWGATCVVSGANVAR